MRTKNYRRTKAVGNKLVVIMLLFWIIIGFGATYAMQQMYVLGSDDKESGANIAQQYIENAMPAISRGSRAPIKTSLDAASEDTISQDTADADAKAGEDDRKSMVFKHMIGTAIPGVDVIDESEKDRTVIQTEIESDVIIAPEQDSRPQVVVGDVAPGENVQIKAQPPASFKFNYKDPLVIIYHTHATESYQPASEGNFHIVEENYTVRQVGNVMKEVLEKQDIKVVHNKTLHDHPSYNQSYNRSLETVKTEIANNSTAKFIIDLHRDAASYSGGQGKTTTIDGKKVATFSIVIGTENPNKDQLTTYANYVIEKANKMYPGIATGIIEKPYKFNEYLSDYYILLEVGNNENQIEEALLCGQYFGNVLAAVIEDIKQ